MARKKKTTPSTNLEFQKQMAEEFRRQYTEEEAARLFAEVTDWIPAEEVLKELQEIERT